MCSCVAYGCTNRKKSRKNGPGITFHRFPKDPIRRQLWILAVRRKDWSPSPWSLLCSAHFTEDMIDRTSVSCVRIRDNAVPTVFVYSNTSSQGNSASAEICTSYSDSAECSSHSDSGECCHCKGNFATGSLSSHQRKCMQRPVKCPDCLEVVVLQKWFDEHECQQEKPEEEQKEN